MRAVQQRWYIIGRAGGVRRSVRVLPAAPSVAGIRNLFLDPVLYLKTTTWEHLKICYTRYRVHPTHPHTQQFNILPARVHKHSFPKRSAGTSRKPTLRVCICISSDVLHTVLHIYNVIRSRHCNSLISFLRAFLRKIRLILLLLFTPVVFSRIQYFSNVKQVN